MPLPKPEPSEITSRSSMNSEPKTAIAPPIAAKAETGTDTTYPTQTSRALRAAIVTAAAPTFNCSRPKHPRIRGSEIYSLHSV